jgi:hypothetical protein
MIAEKTLEVYAKVIEKQDSVMKTEVGTNSNKKFDGKNKPEVKCNK